MAGGGADLLANEIAISLTAGADFKIELPDLSGDEYQVPTPSNDGVFAPIVKIKNEDITTKVVGGTGTFDFFMDGFKAHLKSEYEQGRITGEQYTKAYIALTEGAMANATQFVLGKDQAYWGAVGAQLQARRAEIDVVTARVQLEIEKTRLQTLTYEGLTAQAQYALTKLRLATESVQYDIAKFNLSDMLPLQKTQINKQIEASTAEIANTVKQGVLLTNEAALHPQKLALLTKQVASQEAQTLYVGKQSLALDKEMELSDSKKLLLKEQAEAQRAQTLDTRSDGSPVAGSMGKQQQLYSQQITSYQRDAEMKAAKVFTDAWITMKSLDEGLAPPNMFTNANLDVILTKLKANNGL